MGERDDRVPERCEAGPECEARVEGQDSRGRWVCWAHLKEQDERDRPAAGGCGPGCVRECDVLIVEDQRDVRESLAELLTDLGYAVLTAADGVYALDLLELVRPRLLILDLLMPRLDGWGLLRALRACPVRRDLPAVVLSACILKEREREELRALGAPVLTKGMNLEPLLELVRRQCRP